MQEKNSMIIQSHDFSDTIYLSQISDNNLPYLFLKSYHEFENKCGNETFFAISDDKQIRMPFRILKKYFFKHIQIIFPPLKNNNRLDAAEEKIFLDEFTNLCKTNLLGQRIVQPFLSSHFLATPENSKFCKFGSYYLNIENKSREEITAGFQERYQRAIRSAEKNGAVVKFGNEQLLPFYEIFKSTMLRENKYVDSLIFFENYLKYMQENNLLIAVVYFNEKPEGALWVPYSNYGGFLLYGGSAEKPSHNGIIKYLHAEVIFQLQKLGAKKCFFGGARLSNTYGTKQHHIQEFKERFGCNLEKGFLWKKDINKMASLMYDVSLKVNLMFKGIKNNEDVIDYESGR